MVKVQATVERVDLANRVITLKLPKGTFGDLKVDEPVKNLSQVNMGDQVEIPYTEALAISVEKAKTN